MLVCQYQFSSVMLTYSLYGDAEKKIYFIEYFY